MATYALIVSDSAALRTAASILLPSFDPDITLQFATSYREMELCLLSGRIKSVAIDPNLPGYGQFFTIAQLAHLYPSIRFSTLSPTPAQQLRFEGFEPRPVPPQIAPPSIPDSATPLTARQADVLQLLREGRSTKEIARRLGLAVPTVKTHLAAVYRQLGARNRVEAVMHSVAPRPPFARPAERRDYARA